VIGRPALKDAPLFVPCHQRDNGRVITDTTLQRPAADAWADTLATMPSETASALRRMGRLRGWQDGETVIKAGAVADAMVLIVSGRARLVAMSEQGHEVLFRWFVPGEFVGLASVFGHVPVPTEAIAVGAVQGVVIEREALLAHLRADADGALHFAGIAARLAAEIVQLFAAQITGSLSARILSVLGRLARHEGVKPEAREVKLMLSHQDIANAVGASRQRVSVELRKLERSGSIRLGYRHLVLRTAPPNKH
jgi:CRP-like cAMP-binding protein